MAFSSFLPTLRASISSLPAFVSNVQPFSAFTIGNGEGPVVVPRMECDLAGGLFVQPVLFFVVLDEPFTPFFVFDRIAGEDDMLASGSRISRAVISYRRL